ncbi:hypothetical protein V500_01218 [Pseudogymnoascus sp. VKM F-4518 (FW-2643)]|nr:hypothetical protein V500_01218 [Pseudogymnoascus sp. VKM F-4518 (FW-2643)]
MSWIDHHKKFKEEFYNPNPEHSGFNFEDFELVYEKGGKFLSYPQAETFNETVDTAQTQPWNRSPSSEPLVLTMQEPQISTRTRKIANRSDFTGPAQALLKFARWAFSSEGIPELRILAWGDFSNDGRWGESNVMLCRDQSLEPTGTNFRTLRDSDFNYWDLIDENMDMLSACSPDHLLWAKEAVF